MKTVVICMIGLIVLGLAGCQGEMKTVSSLENNAAIVQPLSQLITATEKGTYYLYSSKDPKSAIYQTDLKKGEELGFKVTGNRAVAVAKGILIELSDFSDGASYQWKLEEGKKE